MNYKRLFVPNSLIFITVVTKYRQEFLIDNISYLRNAFIRAKSFYPFQIVAVIVNQDHFHMIIRPEDITSYPKIVSIIKSTFTKTSKVPYMVNKRGEADVWQKRYWAHTIRNEKDLYKHIDYIHYNSVKHYGISPKNWPYSSFRQFVKNGYYEEDWCNEGDVYQIKNFNLE